jgi:hypothetical protein
MKRAAIAVTAAVLLLTAWGAKPADAALVGDVNGDCAVNGLDLAIVAKHYGASIGSLRYVARYDLNGNGRIDIFDLQMIAAQFGQSC